MTATIPLFPLNTVLFPGMPLPLHIFEERYKQMIADCQQDNGDFGVSLIRDGKEVGGWADPHEVGTLAHIRQTSPLQDGRFYLQTQGTRRFRVRRLIRTRPYLQAEVDYLADAADAGAAHLVSDALALYRQYLDSIRKLGGQVVELQEAGLEPRFLSWLIASTLVVAPPIRQQLLEIDHTDSRLQREIEILHQVTAALQDQMRRGPQPRSFPFSRN